MRKAFAVLSLFLLFSFGLGAYAQQPGSGDRPSREQILKLMEVLHSRDQVTKLMDVMRSQTGAVVHEALKKQNLKLSDTQMADVEKALRAHFDARFTKMPLDQMLNAMVPVYEKHLTKSEVNAMAQFYLSPAGQSFLNKMPVIASESMQAMQPVVLKWSAEMQQDLQVQLRQVVEKYQTSAPKTGNTR
jgi:hypothetical protein